MTTIWSASPSVRNVLKIPAPPSTIREPTLNSASRSRTLSGQGARPGPMALSSPGRRRAAVAYSFGAGRFGRRHDRPTAGAREQARLRACAGIRRSPRGGGALPAVSRTVNCGLSVRTVLIPTRIASCRARRWWVIVRESALLRCSVRPGVAAIEPSSDWAYASVVYGRSSASLRSSPARDGLPDIGKRHGRGHRRLTFG